MMQEIVLIPHERVGVLIGKNGKTKEKLERRTSVKIKIDEQQLEDISLLIAQNRDTLIPILRGAKAPKPVKKSGSDKKPEPAKVKGKAKK